MKIRYALAFTLAAAGLAFAQDDPPPAATEAPEIALEMAVAAQRFIDALDEGMQAKYLFQDAERGNIHFFPIIRRGVPLADLSDGQRQLAYSLMMTGLSHIGAQKAFTIMSLGDHLEETDESPNVHRNSDRYFFTIFGTPEPEGTWGYRVEGFHLSLNVTVIEGRWISATPSFFGAIPATLPDDGPRPGLQVLKNETEFARELASSLTEAQRETGIGEIPEFLTETVGGLTTGNRRKLERGKPNGLAASEMTDEQRELLIRLIREHIERIRGELAKQDFARIDAAGVEKIHFIWAGSLEPGEPHHYLIQGPNFLIEYDNTQDEANHVHCIYRDFDHDFGDALLRHFQKYHN
ncbi:MAG: hypothetical protein ACI8UO_000706 [Verrucomicrobiales bacterium]|jgi:hypothetical protein